MGNVITPVHNEVYKTEKDIISLSCNYSSAASLYWYRQYPGSAPEFLLVILHATGKVLQKSKVVELDPRFSGKLNKEKTHTYLEISSAKVKDSATYYCALEPTVTGKHTTLYKNPPYIKGKSYHRIAEIWNEKTSQNKMQTNVSDAQLYLVAYIVCVQMGLKAETACVEK